MPTSSPWCGRTVPEAELASYDGHELRIVNTHVDFAKGRILLAGLPGAFTPVCSGQHVPNLVAHLGNLKKKYDAVACVVTSDPYCVKAWADTVDPTGRLQFYSDGNAEFAKALKLSARHARLFLGERSERYMMTLRDGIIEALAVEDSIIDFACTRTETLSYFL